MLVLWLCGRELRVNIRAPPTLCDLDPPALPRCSPHRTSQSVAEIHKSRAMMRVPSTVISRTTSSCANDVDTVRVGPWEKGAHAHQLVYLLRVAPASVDFGLRLLLGRFQHLVQNRTERRRILWPRGRLLRVRGTVSQVAATRECYVAVGKTQQR